MTPEKLKEYLAATIAACDGEHRVLEVNITWPAGDTEFVATLPNISIVFYNKEIPQ